MVNEVKLSVFIGSTKEDLSDIRKALIDAVLSAGHIPSGMELWAAGHIPTTQAIEKHLNLCDIHIVVVGSFFGSRTFKDRKGYTQWEYERSKEQERPVIAFLLEENDFNAAVQNQNMDQSELEDLRKFREELRSNAFCRFFQVNDTQRVGRDCINSINETINAGGLPEDVGWIRARSKHGQTLREIDRNPFLRRILHRIYGFSTLTKRLDSESNAKQAMGEAFWKVMIGRIKRQGYYNLFIESGSSLAYVSHEFEKSIRQAGGDLSRWKITTNNAMTLLEFLLYTHIDVVPKPAGAPEDRYGAMFDDVLLKNPETPPRYPRSLFETENKAVESTIKTLQSDKENRLYLATASGLDLHHPTILFRGPHVGSHPNMLFKRAIFLTEQPIILFLDISKLNNDFKSEKCFPVFGPEYTWQQASVRNKLAICFGYSSNVADKEEKLESTMDLARMFVSENPAFDIDYASSETSNGGALILANDLFMQTFKKE